MSVQFSVIVTPQSVSFTTPEGKVLNVTAAHPNYATIIDLVKALQGELKKQRESDTPDFSNANELHTKLTRAADASASIVEAGNGEVDVRDGVVYYQGEAIHNALTRRIVWGLGEGFDMTSYLNFLKNLMENPSKRAIDETYTFLERNNMGITDDGYILGYKRVRDNFFDLHSNTMDNSPGKVVEMPRGKVDDDKDRTCSTGLHFCSLAYLPHFGAGGGNRVVIVKVNPCDVVSVPSDYDAAKVRACRYEVLSEYTGSDKDDLLATKAVWSTSSFRDDYDDTIDDEDYSDDEDYDDEDADYYDDGEDECDDCGEYKEFCECDDGDLDDLEDRSYSDDGDDDDGLSDDDGESDDYEDDFAYFERENAAASAVFDVSEEEEAPSLLTRVIDIIQDARVLYEGETALPQPQRESPLPQPQRVIPRIDEPRTLVEEEPAPAAPKQEPPKGLFYFDPFTGELKPVK